MGCAFWMPCVRSPTIVVGRGWFNIQNELIEFSCEPVQSAFLRSSIVFWTVLLVVLLQVWREHRWGGVVCAGSGPWLTSYTNWRCIQMQIWGQGCSFSSMPHCWMISVVSHRGWVWNCMNLPTLLPLLWCRLWCCIQWLTNYMFCSKCYLGGGGLGNAYSNVSCYNNYFVQYATRSTFFVCSFYQECLMLVGSVRREENGFNVLMTWKVYYLLQL